MTDRLRAAAQAALEALESVKDSRWNEDSVAGRKLLADLRAALAEQEDAEPVAWSHNLIDNIIRHRPTDIDRHPDRWTPLYTAPPRRKWQSLTDEERLDAIRPLCEENEPVLKQLLDLSMDEYRAIETALKEKNCE